MNNTYISKRKRKYSSSEYLIHMLSTGKILKRRASVKNKFTKQKRKFHDNKTILYLKGILKGREIKRQ